MTITFPEPPRASPRTPFPLIAVIAPVIAAVVIGAIIRSPYVLVFAALSPIIAGASAIESRRAARRHATDEAARFAAECATTEEAIERAHRDETERAFAADVGEHGTIVGAAPAASTIAGPVPTLDAHPDRAVSDRVRALQERAARNPRLPVRVPHGPVAVVGEGVVADRLRAVLGDHRVTDRASAAPGGTVVTVTALSCLDILYPGGSRVRAEAVIPYAADERARRVRTGAGELPGLCTWSETTAGVSERGLVVGAGADGPIALDLITDGPHVLVGGATGSGKSEFLRALALSAAADPHSWSVLYVDFKGGATFHDLGDLPSSVGVITDLDATLAARALTSLQAEIARRERVLARERVRDIAQLSAGLSRLLIVVDEYAALVQTHPTLQAVFADLSARGRSLGIHLILCTQRPSGVVHDTVAVNCAIRVLFRTTDVSDARALLGADAPSVVAAPRGRAAIRVHDTVLWAQVCLVEADDIVAVAARTSAVSSDRDRPWAPLLPDELPPSHADVVDARRGALAEGALLIGLIDDVAAQRWSAATWSPHRDGALAVLGCPGSGRTTVLAQLAAEAESQGWAVTRVPESLSDAQQVLTAITAEMDVTATGRHLLVVDGLAELLESETPERTAALVEQLDAARRHLHQRGGGVAVDGGTASTAGRLLAGRFGARVQLRALDRDDHDASGAPRGSHDDRAPAGRGWWRGHLLQVIHAEQPLPPAARPQITTVGSEPVIAVISTNPEASIAAVRASSPTRVRVVPPAEFTDAVVRSGEELAVIACVGYPDEWQRQWAALAHARRVGITVFDGCDASDMRSLVSPRVQLPPIDPGDLWAIDAGQSSTPAVRRARWAASRRDATESGSP